MAGNADDVAMGFISPAKSYMAMTFPHSRSMHGLQMKRMAISI